MSNHKGAVIFLNGAYQDPTGIKRHISPNALLVGCDGGTDQLMALGYKPAVVIGDLDSLAHIPTEVVKHEPDGSPITVDGVVFMRYPTDKDFTDAELALDYVCRLGHQDIIIVGALGERLDHSVGNMLMLGKSKFADCMIRIIEGDQEIYVARDKVRIDGKRGDTISFLPIFGDVQAESSKGLKYDLSRYQMSYKSNLGISNVLTSKTANIVIAKGILLVVHTKQAALS